MGQELRRRLSAASLETEPSHAEIRGRTNEQIFGFR